MTVSRTISAHLRGRARATLRSFRESEPGSTGSTMSRARLVRQTMAATVRRAERQTRRSPHHRRRFGQVGRSLLERMVSRAIDWIHVTGSSRVHRRRRPLRDPHGVTKPADADASTFPRLSHTGLTPRTTPCRPASHKRARRGYAGRAEVILGRKLSIGGAWADRQCMQRKGGMRDHAAGGVRRSDGMDGSPTDFHPTGRASARTLDPSPVRGGA